MKKQIFALTFCVAISIPAFAIDLRGSLGVETRYFTSAKEFQTSLFIEPEWYWQNEDSSSSVTLKPFARLDELDEERSHLDIREFFYQYANDNLELRAGINKIFWGVTESQHLVDVINQTDYLEGFDGEDKLGQPMIQLTSIHNWGAIDFFVLPYFREREFSGKDGHFNFKMESGSQIYYARFNDAIYESRDEEQHLDAAIRYSHSIGDWDFGLSYFDGTQRDPYFYFTNLNPTTEEFSITPYYVQMQQWGIDLQATLGSWLWKAELISREVLNNRFSAATAGFEYTFYGVSESGADLGVLLEINRNDNQRLAQSAAQNDLFAGGRYTWNDEQSSEILFGISQDLENSNSYAAKIEANRRLGNNYKITLDSWFFNSSRTEDPLFNIREEDFVQLAVEYYF
jgi:hypothetical protein